MTSPPFWPPSFYTASARIPPPLPPLREDARCDVCIIGGGYTGLSSALHLAERGYSVTLLEAERVGWGASGRNGGQLGTTHRKTQRELISLVGDDHADALWELARESNATVRDLIRRHNIACDLKDGILHAAWKRRDAADLAADAEFMAHRYGHPLRILSATDVGDTIASRRYYGGVLDMAAGHLHPLNYALGLARAARAAGARLHENTKAVEILHGRPVRVRTADATITSDCAVIAGNGYIGNLERKIAGRIMPINNFIAATETLDEDIIRGGIAVADTKFMIDYYRLSADRRLLFGGGENYASRFPRNIAAFVRRPMGKVFPQLKKARIDFAWGGTLAVTVNRMPDFGRLNGNVFYAHGYSGQGINIATLAGKLIAEAVAGTAERFDVMARVPTPAFPGGTLLRWPALVAGMLYYRLRDRL